MTSNADTLVNTPAAPAGIHHQPARSSSPPKPQQTHPSPLEPSWKPDHASAPPAIHQNGHDDQDAEGESEAETVVLSRDENPVHDKMIKTERVDDDDDNNNNSSSDATRLHSIKEESRPHSPQPNGRQRPPSHVKINGAKSPAPTSPNTRTKDASPNETAKSRGRSASTVENRKRKVRDDSFPFEPPRQKARTDTPGFGRPHKRSQSTQSTATGIAGRKRREVTNLALSNEEHWSGSSSDHSTSPQPLSAPHLQQHARVKRTTHRALTSPARTMPQRKIDRFGATRLARESEKGDLDAVKEAYEEAPDELDQPDYAGIAPLQKASLHGWAPVVRYLISKGCRTNCESHDRDTPLIDAVENSHLDVVRLLLNQGQVNPHHSNKKGQRAIDVLDPEDEDAPEIEKELREAMRRRVDTSNNDPERSQKQAKTASRLLYNEFNVETLIEKAGDGDILAVGELINSNIKPNITCGVAAARGGHYDILSILLASGLKADPDPSKHPETPMTVAIGRGYLKIIQLLLEQDNFNPTRRNKDQKTYYEISEERHGPKWEEERDMLKRACEEYQKTHRSPRRTKKEPPNPSANRMKRKSPPRRDRSSSPQAEPKRANLTKATAASTAPQKSRRLMSGKEKASREGQRRKRVVDEDSSEEESEEDVRPPTRKVKQRSYSEGEEAKPARKALKARSDDNESKRPARPRSDESDEDHGTKHAVKAPVKPPKTVSAKPTPEIDSPDERKVVKNKIKYKTMEDKIRKRKLSDASADDMSLKRTPTVSAKSTPAPPDRIATPEVERARRQEEQQLQVEAKRKAAQAAAEAEAKKKEAEEAARKAAEIEEAKKRAEAEAEARRQAEEAEAARVREEQETQRRAEEEAKRQKELLERQDRISRLPRALRRACELGTNRPLHFSGEELGVSAVFLPLFYANAQDLRDSQALPNKTYVCSFQVVGILGLPELDLAHLAAPYSDWTRIPVNRIQRDAILRQYDVALLAQDFRFPMEGAPDFDYTKIQDSIKEAKNQFSAMEGLYWVEESLLHAEVEKVDTLRPLLPDMRADCKRRRIHLADVNDELLEKKHKPRKSFMDIVLAQKGTNGTAPAITNGNG
ncbi:ankyrin repeat-containing protein [Stemphylium lycopersici]|uniref:Ankyrin repeat-containing protein n=1 Tax=Stemphylium lycopersici TaxID=183478 RepID=A0A364MWR1_STELY|nr:ankyrin repeat-containing protein [Stemphylium lycopersici]RAR03180.1 ankyrin repeat-containing protein [Stemphylium lycopersici]RAR05895.1 ankyrin repeat-containing protein [Stemphylium lycopersici]